MVDRMVIAVPSMGAGGLEAERSAHFGQCDCFTVVEARDDEIADVRIVDNPPHEHGGCLRPVALLAAEGVDSLIAAGMGARPLAGFAEAGISVYFEDRTPGVGDAVSMVMAGSVETMDARHSCGCDHH